MSLKTSDGYKNLEKLEIQMQRQHAVLSKREQFIKLAKIKSPGEEFINRLIEKIRPTIWVFSDG